MPVNRWTSAGALAIAGALTIGSMAYAAEPPGSTALLLTVGSGEKTLPPADVTTLTCDPAGGGHPSAAEACHTLAAVDARLAALNVDPGMCTREHDPVTVTVQGSWRGRPVHDSAGYSNRCEARRATGVVFAF